LNKSILQSLLIPYIRPITSAISCNVPSLNPQSHPISPAPRTPPTAIMSSPQLAAANAFLQSFKTLDAASNLSLRTPGCTHNMGPASLHFPPSQTNAEWAAHLEGIKEVLTEFPVTAKEIFEAGNQVTVHAVSEAIFKEDVKDEGAKWEYRGEYVFILFFEEGGKIERIFEFLDSKLVLEVQALIGRAKKNLAARAS